MVIVNYIEENLRFIEFASMNRVSGNERLIWYALVYIINKHANGALWPDSFIAIPNRVLLTYAPISEDTLIRARNQLVQHGLIEYKPGKKRAADPEYRLCYFHAQPVAESGQCGLYPQSAGKTPGNMTGNPAFNAPAKPADIRINIDYTGNIDSSMLPRSVQSPETGEEKDLRSLSSRVAARLGEDFSDAGFDDEAIDRLSEKRRRGLRSFQQSRSQQRMAMILLDSVRYEPLRSMYQGHERLFRELVESAEFPLELVDMAVQQTQERCERGRLGNPIAYTLKLLRDWQAREIGSLEELSASLRQGRRDSVCEGRMWDDRPTADVNLPY